jgi:hypothetical protein
MWIKMLSIAAGPHFHYLLGQVVDVDDATAKEWIRANHAEPASAPANPAARAPEETATVSADETAATVQAGSPFAKLTGKGKGAGKGRSGNPEKPEPAADATADDQPDGADSATS